MKMLSKRKSIAIETIIIEFTEVEKSLLLDLIDHVDRHATCGERMEEFLDKLSDELTNGNNEIEGEE